ncbi:exonuclease domain-containing protein [Alicyclobacillus suci]|uniref:exonuclease domain-containing protein n=1 Tax=Alicyclobacillus suci TaxID=2816080 RepID=UPI002E27CEA0|nr:exonuclease domain-containing protein [Alicyclobacillus suci]
MRWFRGANRGEDVSGLNFVPTVGTSAQRVWESALSDAQYFVIDIETSGFSAQTDLVLSLAAGCMTGLDDFSQFFYQFVRHPDISRVPQTIWDITGLSPEIVQGGRDMPDVLEEALSMSLNRVWIAHHARHELSFLGRHARQLWKLQLRPIVIDTAVVAQALGRLPRVPTLDETCVWLGVPVQGRHQADADVRMTAEVWKREIVLCQRLGLRTVVEVIDWASARAMG